MPARLEQSPDGRTVAVDARTSSDEDANVVRYLWEFGDGSIAEGPTALRTYSTPGTYRFSLAVQAHRGEWRVATAETVIDVPVHDFRGFLSPVDNEPTLNRVMAGSAVPIKFGLGGDFGLDVLAAGTPSSRTVECSSGVPVHDIESTVTAGSSALQYDEATDITPMHERHPRVGRDLSRVHDHPRRRHHEDGQLPVPEVT